MKIVFDNSKNELKKGQYVLCIKRPKLWSRFVDAGCFAKYTGDETYTVAVDVTKCIKGTMEQLGTDCDSFVKIREIKYEKGDIVYYITNSKNKCVVTNVYNKTSGNTIEIVDDTNISYMVSPNEVYPAPLYVQPNTNRQDYTLHLIVNDPVVIASLVKVNDDTDSTIVEKSICSPEDKFDASTGIKIAIYKLLTKENLNIKTYITISNLSVGTVFKYCGRRWVKFNHYNDCMCCESVINSIYDEYDDDCLSSIKYWDNTYLYKQLVEKLNTFVNEKQLDYTDRDIVADDGSMTYLSYTKVRLITCEEWRENYSILTNAIDDTSFWTMTPDCKNSNLVKVMQFNNGFTYVCPNHTFDVLPVIRLKPDVKVEEVDD